MFGDDAFSRFSIDVAIAHGILIFQLDLDQGFLLAESGAAGGGNCDIRNAVFFEGIHDDLHRLAGPGGDPACAHADHDFRPVCSGAQLKILLDFVANLFEFFKTFIQLPFLLLADLIILIGRFGRIVQISLVHVRSSTVAAHS